MGEAFKYFREGFINEQMDNPNRHRFGVAKGGVNGKEEMSRQ